MHCLIVGITLTGKTNLAKSIAREKSASGENVIIFDPLQSAGWPDNAEKFVSIDKFFERMETAQSAFVFVDEGKTLWDKNPKEADKLLYRRRHQGLLVFVLAQRTRMIPPNARNQCHRVFAFKQQMDDADTLAQEYAPEFRECVDLPQGDFIVSDGFAVEHLRLDYQNYPPTIAKRGD